MTATCTRCTALPGRPAEAGTLCMAPPLAHTFGVVRDLLRREAIPHEETARQVLAITLAPGRLARLAEVIGGALSRAELSDTRSILLNEGESLSLDDLARMQPLASLLAGVRGAWLPEMLADDRLTTHFQPIVRADAPGEVFAQECLLRGLDRDGSIIPPGRIYETAREAGLMFQLDRAARLTAIRTAAGIGLDDRLFINFNPTSIYDPLYCLRSTFAAAREAGIRPDRIVFEVVESDEIGDLAHLRRIVDFYRQAGFRVALDDLGSGFGSLNLLAELRPDFVKLDMQLIRGIDADPFKATIVAKLLELARELGVVTVTEGIETEGEWDWVREHGADLAQGYFFARPAATPARVRAA